MAHEIQVDLCNLMKIADRSATIDKNLLLKFVKTGEVPREFPHFHKWLANERTGNVKKTFVKNISQAINFMYLNCLFAPKQLPLRESFSDDLAHSIALFAAYFQNKDQSFNTLTNAQMQEVIDRFSKFDQSLYEPAKELFTKMIRIKDRKKEDKKYEFFSYNAEQHINSQLLKIQVA
jgi:hypothetical protein